MVSWLSSGPQNVDLKVLVVSDDANARTSICDVLLEAGCIVHYAPSAALAIDYLTESPMPDLLIVDFLEPETDGKYFVEVSRLRFGRKTLAPLLFLMDDAGDERTAQIMDIDDVLPKSSNGAVLLERVQNIAQTAAAK